MAVMGRIGDKRPKCKSLSGRIMSFGRGYTLDGRAKRKGKKTLEGAVRNDLNSRYY